MITEQLTNETFVDRVRAAADVLESVASNRELLADVPAEDRERLVRLAGDGQLAEGEFTPGAVGREWTDNGVLRQLRRRSLARLRHEIEPVEQAVLGRLATSWQAVTRRRHGPDALLDVIEQLQGAPLAASILETEILPARIAAYDPADLDAIASAGEVVWRGIEPLGARAQARGQLPSQPAGMDTPSPQAATDAASPGNLPPAPPSLGWMDLLDPSQRQAPKAALPDDPLARMMGGGNPLGFSMKDNPIRSMMMHALGSLFV